jgi:hypothetical protein
LNFDLILIYFLILVSISIIFVLILVRRRRRRRRIRRRRRRRRRRDYIIIYDSMICDYVIIYVLILVLVFILDFIFEVQCSILFRRAPTQIASVASDEEKAVELSQSSLTFDCFLRGSAEARRRLRRAGVSKKMSRIQEAMLKATGTERTGFLGRLSLLLYRYCLLPLNRTNTD